MREDLNILVKAIYIAQSRGVYSLEESAIIYQCLKGLNQCPRCNPPVKKEEKKDLDMIIEDLDEDSEME